MTTTPLRTDVMPEQTVEFFAHLRREDVLLEFGTHRALLELSDFDHAVEITVDVLLEQVANFHDFSP